MTRLDDFTLTPEELQARKRGRRRRFIVAGIVVLLLLIGAFTARPAGRAIKAWQARRHAEKAFTFIDQEKWNEARDSAVAAYQLRPTEPKAIRAVARLLSRTGQEQAFEFWDQLDQRTTLTRRDYQEKAIVAFSVGDVPRAEAAVAKLLKLPTEEAGPQDWLLAAQAAAQKSDVVSAQSWLDKVLQSGTATNREQLQAAKMKLQFSGASAPEQVERERAEAWRRVSTLAFEEHAVALEALMLLAQARLALDPDARTTERTSSPAEAKAAATDWSALELAEAIGRHPLATTAHHLIASDLRIYADPAQSPQLMEGAVEKWRGQSTESHIALARWLNSKGEFQRHLDAIPLTTESAGSELLLHHLDALGSLGRWADVKTLLESYGSSLDPAVQQMYLARCNAQLGLSAASENSWQRALEAAQGDARKLFAVGEYAERNNSLSVAEEAYTAAAVLAPKFRQAQQGRLRLAHARRDTRRVQAVLAEMLQVWPEERAIQNDEAYMRLLLLPAGPSAEVSAIESLAQGLVERFPDDYAHRTLLALARLKQQRAAEALDVYAGFDPPASALSSSAAAVRAAVLEATGLSSEARQITVELQSQEDSLLPEEQALLAPVIEAGAPAGGG